MLAVDAPEHRATAGWCRRCSRCGDRSLRGRSRRSPTTCSTTSRRRPAPTSCGSTRACCRSPSSPRSRCSIRHAAAVPGLGQGRGAEPDLGLGVPSVRRTEEAARGSQTAGCTATSTGCTRTPATTSSASSSTWGRRRAAERRGSWRRRRPCSRGGFERVNLIGNGAVLLLRHPDQLASLRDDPGRWPNAVEEVLRFDSPVQNTRACASATLAGRDVPAESPGGHVPRRGEPRPGVFERPGVRRPAANARDHLAFSAGVHYCLGAAGATGGRGALRRLFERFPDLALIGEPHRRPTRTLRGTTRPGQLGTRAEIARGYPFACVSLPA